MRQALTFAAWTVMAAMLPAYATPALAQQVSPTPPSTPTAQTAQPTTAPAISLDRIIRGLQHDGLRLETDQPTFRVKVTETRPYDNPFGVSQPSRDKSWAERVNQKIGTGAAPLIALSAATASLAGDGGMSAAPLVLMDVIAVGTMVAGKISQVRRSRKVRQTRDRVRTELEEFCAANGCVAPSPP